MATAIQPESTAELDTAAFVKYLLAHSPREEQRVLLEDVPWEQYEALHEEFARSVRLSWMDGTLEIMAPISEEHESRSYHFSALIGRYCEETGIRFRATGSASLMNEFQKAGCEPDESFYFEDGRDRPNLAIEVALTSGGLSKLPIFARYGIPEVWIWRDDQLEVFILKGQDYERSRKSECLPELNLELLVRCVRMEWYSDAVKVFLTGLSG